MSLGGWWLKNPNVLQVLRIDPGGRVLIDKTGTHGDLAPLPGIAFGSLEGNLPEPNIQVEPGGLWIAFFRKLTVTALDPVTDLSRHRR